MEIFNYYLYKYEMEIILIIILLIVIIFISWFKGANIKIFGIEIKNKKQKNIMEKKDDDKTFITGKNINTGTNYGHVGDNYTGITQRHIDENDKEKLINDLSTFKSKYSDKINKSHIIIGYPGDKESIIFANEVSNFLYNLGYTKIDSMILQTYGAYDQRIGVSNAPDDSILIEIYPANNV